MVTGRRSNGAAGVDVWTCGRVDCGRVECGRVDVWVSKRVDGERGRKKGRWKGRGEDDGGTDRRRTRDGDRGTKNGEQRDRGRWGRGTACEPGWKSYCYKREKRLLVDGLMT